MSRIIDRAEAIARIHARARLITTEYRLLWNRHQRCFVVAHKHDRGRRYRISATGCDCPSMRFYGTCKHWLGLAEMARVEIERYTWLAWREDLARVRSLMEEYLRRSL